MKPAHAGGLHVIRRQLTRLWGNLLGKPPHRGAIDKPGEFAKRFVRGRLGGFEKDIRICLTPFPSKTRTDPTHAYFPALGACCGLLEYLTAMYCGRKDNIGPNDVARWAACYLPQPDYCDYSIHVLVKAFRNSVAHRGIASGVWIDPKPGQGYQRRLTWTVHEDDARPSIRIVEERRTLIKDPPWPCKYTHRVHVHLRSLADDLILGATKYADDVSGDRALQRTFQDCMRDLYPE